MAKGRYYLGRLTKAGLLTDELLLQALARPAVVSRGSHAWTIVNLRTIGDSPDGVYGKLAKFLPAGEVKVLKSGEEVVAPEENLLVASSPFVYAPKHAGVAGLHVWNQIEHQTFRARFGEVIEESLDRFFVDCSLEPISDLESFVSRLRAIERVDEISAAVVPPNPLFGPAWRPVVEYLKRRHASKLRVTEKAGAGGLRTEIAEVVSRITSSPESAPLRGEQLDLTDAAVLMAADGYGTARIRGRVGRRAVQVRTTDIVRSFEFERDPDPELLYREAETRFRSVVQERGLRHEGDE